MKYRITKATLSLFIIMSNASISLGNEGGKLAQGFTDLFIELFAKLLLFVLCVWLIGKLLYWLIDNKKNKQ